MTNILYFLRLRTCGYDQTFNKPNIIKKQKISSQIKKNEHQNIRWDAFFSFKLKRVDIHFLYLL